MGIKPSQGCNVFGCKAKTPPITKTQKGLFAGGVCAILPYIYVIYLLCVDRNKLFI